MPRMLPDVFRAIGWAVLLLSMSGPVGCRSHPEPSEAVLTVHNRLARAIFVIERKDCEQDDSAFAPIEDTRMRPGETRRVALPEGCVDLLARDTRGRVVGRQDDLRILPGASWVLRR